MHAVKGCGLQNVKGLGLGFQNKIDGVKTVEILPKRDKTTDIADSFHGKTSFGKE